MYSDAVRRFSTSAMSELWPRRRGGAVGGMKPGILSGCYDAHAQAQILKTRSDKSQRPVVSGSDYVKTDRGMSFLWLGGENTQVLS